MGCHGFSCSTEESMYEGPQTLGPLLPVEAWPGIDIPAAALHAALRVRLLPEQKVRTGQQSWEGSGLHQGCGRDQCPRQEGRLVSPRCLVLAVIPRAVLVVSAKPDWWGRRMAAVIKTGPPGQCPGSSSVSRTSGPLFHRQSLRDHVLVS